MCPLSVLQRARAVSRFTEMDGNGRKRTFVATEKDSLDTETDSLGTETDRNGPKRTFSDEFAWANFSLNSS